MIILIVSRDQKEIDREDAQEDKEIKREDDKLARSDDNDFNIRKAFLANAGAAIKDMTLGQYCIMILTDQENDVEKTEMKGMLAPMGLIEVPISDGEKINFQVMVFDEGMYVRAGSMKGDSIWCYPPDAKRDFWEAHDKWPTGTHFEFTPRPKLPVEL